MDPPLRNEDGERPAKRAKTTKQASWDEFKNDIYELYAVKNYSIEDLMSAMTAKGLRASRRTYMKRITEWGFNKKIRRSEKEQMLRIERHRSAIGKKTTFRIRGQEVTAAKLRRAGPAVEEVGSPLGDADMTTPSCISYETPDTSAFTDEPDIPPADDAPVFTPEWAMDPEERFWRTRSTARNRADTSLLTLPEPTLEPYLPLAYERDVVTFFNDMLEGDDDVELVEWDNSDVETVTDTSFPKDFKLRKLLTSTMVSLNFEFHQATAPLVLGTPASTRYLSAGPSSAVSVVATRGNSPDVSDAGDIPPRKETSTEDDLNRHLSLFRADASEYEAEDRDRARHRHFSNVLGVIKSRYDREAATLKLMGMVFGDGDVENEEQARDKVEALLAQRHRLFGFEAPETLEACLAGVIFLLDATRLDAEQNTWEQAVSYGRLSRARSLIARIFSSLQEDTMLELMGDDEGLDVEPKDESDENPRERAERMMGDIVDQAMKSTTVLHALQLLPRYHRQWAGYHWHRREEMNRERPSLYTK